MEPVHSNSPVIARAFDFAQEAKRKRELEQQAAVKTENRTDEQHPNRVFFSQEAQIKLSEEKSSNLNRVNEVRVANNIKAAEVRSEAMRQDAQKAAQIKTEDRLLREDRDRVARDKAAKAFTLMEASNKKIQESAQAAFKLKADQTAKAIDAQTEALKSIHERENALALELDIAKRAKGYANIEDKSNVAIALKNFTEDKRHAAATTENLRVYKATNERVQAETARAVKMYDHVKKI